MWKRASRRVPDKTADRSHMISAQQIENFARAIRSKLKPVRVLHIVENLHYSGRGILVIAVVNAAVKYYPNVHWTFFCTVGKAGRLDTAARALGAEVIHSRYEIGDKVRFFVRCGKS